MTVDDVEIVPANLLVPLYLAASYSYYHLSAPPLADATFDAVCRRLLREYDDIKHEHKHLVDVGSLEAGTCMLRHDQYPRRVRDSSELFRDVILSGTYMEAIRENYIQPKSSERPTDGDSGKVQAPYTRHRRPRRISGRTNSVKKAT